MGLILDTTILIAIERSVGSPEDILHRARTRHGETVAAISAVTVVELTHGVYRARSEYDRARRRVFAEKAFHDLTVQPVTLEMLNAPGGLKGSRRPWGT